MRQRATEPVQFPDDQAIVRPDVVKRLLESWAIIPRPAGSCTSPLRIIVSPRKPSKMPQFNLFWRGQGHGLTPFLLPTRRVGTRMVLRSVACHWVQARPTRPTHASAAQAQTLHRAQTVRGSDAQPALRPV